MKRISLFLVCLLLLFTGCTGENDTSSAGTPKTASESSQTQDESATLEETPTDMNGNPIEINDNELVGTWNYEKDQDQGINGLYMTFGADGNVGFFNSFYPSGNADTENNVFIAAAYATYTLESGPLTLTFDSEDIQSTSDYPFLFDQNLIGQTVSYPYSLEDNKLTIDFDSGPLTLEKSENE